MTIAHPMIVVTLHNTKSRGFWKTWNRFAVNMAVVIGTVGVVQPAFSGKLNLWLILMGAVATMVVMAFASYFSFFIEGETDV